VGDWQGSRVKVEVDVTRMMVVVREGLENRVWKKLPRCSRRSRCPVPDDPLRLDCEERACRLQEPA
jgi:hypothetical protein